MKYGGNMVYIAVVEGEILGVFINEDNASHKVAEYERRNFVDECHEAGYNLSEISMGQISEFEYSAGFNGGVAYYDSLLIPSDPDSNDDDEDKEDVVSVEDIFETFKGDQFSYLEIISKVDELYEAWRNHKIAWQKDIDPLGKNLTEDELSVNSFFEDEYDADGPWEYPEDVE